MMGWTFLNELSDMGKLRDSRMGCEAVNQAGRLPARKKAGNIPGPSRLWTAGPSSQSQTPPSY